MNTNTELDPARFRAAAGEGLRVFPLKPREKIPALAWKRFQVEAPTVDELEQWDQGDNNVGIVCGAPSGLVVLDVDSAAGQVLMDSLDLPVTPTVRTARGLHYYFRRPDYEIRNTVHVGGVELDVRGDGGYVVGPGSIHRSGARYEWIVSPAEAPFAALPDKLVALLRATKPPSTVTANEQTHPEPHLPINLGRWLMRRLDHAKAELSGAVQGTRNNTLFKVAVRLASDVSALNGDWAHYMDALSAAAQQIGLDHAEVAATLCSAWTRGSEQPTDWLRVAREWAWLAKPDVFYHLESGEHLKPEAFKKRFAKYRVGEVPLAGYVMKHELIPMVHDLTYEPREADLLIERDGLPWLNTYRPSPVTAVEGDPSPFVEFMEYLVPDDDERQHLLQMIAWSVRNPGLKIRHALLLRSREQGIGKTMLTDIWGQLVGLRNVRKTTTEEVSGNFQGFIKEKLLIALEELNWGVGPTGYNRLKALITEDIVPVNEKYMPVRHWPNYATLAILTNLPVPLLIEDSDRRIFFIDSPALRRDKSYYRDFVNWWQNNMGVIRGYMDQVDLSTFEPNAPPPMTVAKQALIAESQSGLAKDLLLAIDQRSGVFDRDTVTLLEVERELGSSARLSTRAQLTKALKDVGAVPFKQQRVPGYWRDNIFLGLPDRASLWAIRNPNYWSVAGNAARGEEYSRREGLLSPFDGLPLHIRHISELPQASEPIAVDKEARIAELVRQLNATAIQYVV